jgi:rubrerythrin
METNKQKYIKYIRQQIKEQDKWKNEAISLLKDNGIENPEDHKSIQKYLKKINDLEKEISDFDLESDGFKSFIEKEKMSHPSIKKSTNNQELKNNNFDRWADVKIDNNIKREINWLNRMDNYMPQYMKDNLQKMPNNKGYIWKKIHYRGFLPAEEPSDLTIMFEKQGSSLVIHEYSKKSYKIFEKKEKNRPKELIYEKK